MQQIGIGKALGAFLALTLVAGIAWALETETVATPGGNGFVVTAVVTPGSGGAEVYGPGGMRDDQEGCYSVRFEDDWQLTVNGTSGPSFNPNAQYTVVGTFTKINGAWFVDTVVSDSNGVVMTVNGYSLSAEHDEVNAEAATVHSLSVQ